MIKTWNDLTISIYKRTWKKDITNPYKFADGHWTVIMFQWMYKNKRAAKSIWHSQSSKISHYGRGNLFTPFWSLHHVIFLHRALVNMCNNYKLQPLLNRWTDDLERNNSIKLRKEEIPYTRFHFLYYFFNSFPFNQCTCLLVPRNSWNVYFYAHSGTYWNDR